MSPSQLAELQVIATGRCPQVHRTRYRWYLRRYLKELEIAGARRIVQLTTEGCQAIGVPRTDARLPIILNEGTWSSHPRGAR